MNIPDGLYESAYTMNTDDETIVVSDRITFTSSGQTALGVGERDKDGLQMKLKIEQGNVPVTGSWEECDDTGQVTVEGQLEFVIDSQDRFVGCWSMAEGDSGTWVLIKSLGRTANQG